MGHFGMGVQKVSILKTLPGFFFFFLSLLPKRRPVLSRSFVSTAGRTLQGGGVDIVCGLACSSSFDKGTDL